MKKIPLSQGKIVIVDDDDYSFLMQWKWCFSNGYAIRGTSKTVDGIKKHISVFMHREINKTPDGLITDHVNGDKLDNRKSNLRSASYLQNQMNKRAWGKSTSKYKGVFWRKDLGIWTSQIRINGKQKHLGFFENESDAAEAYKKLASEYHKDFAVQS